MSRFEQTFGQTQQGQPSGTPARKRPAQPEFATVHCLLVVEPSGKERVFAVRESLTIGRDNQNTVVLPDPYVLPYHLSIRTDGSQFWYQAQDPNAQIQCDGVVQSEGSLTDGEHLVIGRSQLFFFAPQAGAIDPALLQLDFSEFAKLSDEADNKLAEFASVLDEPFSSEQVAPKKPRSKVHFLFLGIYVLQIAVVWIGFDLFALQQPPSSEAKTPQPDPTTDIFHAVVKVGSLVQNNKWREADQLLRDTTAKAPKNHPMLPILQKRATQVTAEIVQLDALHKAKQLSQEDQWVDSLGLIAKIPQERYAYRDGQALRQEIFVKEVKPLLQTIGTQIESDKYSEARKNIEKVMMYDPNMAEAVDLQQRLEKRDPEGSRLANQAALEALNKGFLLFRSGKYPEAADYFKQLESTAVGLTKRKAAAYQQQVESFVDTLQRGINASNRNNHNQAAVLLLRAHNLCKAMGASSSRFIRRLANAYYHKGKQAADQKQFGRALGYYKQAMSYVSGYGPANAEILSMQRKASSMYNQAILLKGVDDAESRRLMRLVTQLVPSSHPLYRKAKRHSN